MSILLVLFVGYVGFSIIFPVLPSMFLDPKLGYLPGHLTLSTRNILLGIMIAMYPLGQFFACPILGRLSDTYGRKPILLITLFCTSLMYIITAMGVEFKAMAWIFLGRFLTGIFEGNITIATAVMADLSTEKIDKAKNFGWLLTFSSTGWIVGPLLGGWLADPSVVQWFSYSTPFWTSSGFLLICFFIVLLSFNESLDGRHRKKYLHFSEIFTTFTHLFKYPLLRKIYAANFFFYVSCFIFFIYFGTLIYRWFNCTPRMIGNLEAYVSIFICFAPLTYSYLAKKFEHHKIMVIASLGLAISLILVLLFPNWVAIWFTFILPSYFIALGISFTSLLISDSSSRKEQGEALGLNTAIMVLAETIVGLLGGVLIAFWLYLPYVVAVLCCFISALFAISCRKKAKRNGKNL